MPANDSSTSAQKQRPSLKWTPRATTYGALVHAVYDSTEKSMCNMHAAYRAKGWRKKKGAAVTCMRCLLALARERPS